MMSRQVALAFLILFISLRSVAQQFRLQGSASQTGPLTYQMTPDVGNQAGMITSYYPLDLTMDHYLAFQLYFGSKDVNGADGLAFMLSNNCNPTLTPGQGLGVANTPNSLVVDFDTWDNGVAYNDIPDDHCGIYADGNFSVAGNIMDGTSTPVCMLPACGNVETGQWYDVEISWTYISASSQRIEIWLNGNLLCTSTQNHIANRFNNNSIVFWSVAASTGGSSNLQQFRLYNSNSSITHCEGDNFTLYAPELGTNYVWSGSSSTSNSANYTATSNVTITCNYTSYCGMNETVSFNIVVIHLTAPAITSNSPICAGGDAIFYLAGSAGNDVTYSINGGPPLTATLDASGSATITIPGVTTDQDILVSSISDGTCTRSVSLRDTVFVSQALSPPQLANNGPVCSGSTGVFTLQGSPGDTVHYQVNGGIDQTVLITASGSATINLPGMILSQTVHATKVSKGPCTLDIDLTSTIDVLPVARTTVDTTICEGNSYAGYSTSGTYTDTYPGSNGCDSIRTLHLSISQVRRPDLGPDRAICQGDTIRLAPGSYTTYSWQDGSTQPVFYVITPGTYSVTVSTSCGSSTDEVMILAGDCDVYFPSAFTPDNNGRNDFFHVVTDQRLDEYELEVFNRWGMIVFNATEQTKGWNGMIKGEPAGAGTYIWVSSFRYKGEKRFMKGTVTLIR